MASELYTQEENRQKWIDIQLHTFTNWVNEQILSPTIADLSTDLSDGVALIRLVESLQGRKYFGKIYKNDPTEIQKLMNVQMALDALREDRVKTVNIGSHDIVEGNIKLILGLIWCLVQRYQIASRTKIPPKKLVMAWMQSILPDLKLTNFRTNWNDGQALCALLDYCQPGLCPEWKQMDLSQKLENCKRALALSEQYLGIPQIISPEHLSSPHLDELSCLTYLSYFITKGAPGYRATLQKVQLLLPDVVVEDFETSWSDGYLLSLLTEAVGGSVPELDEQMQFNTLDDCILNISLALEAAAEIGVGSLVGAEDIADPQGEHLGTMALAAALCSIGPQVAIPVTQCFLNQQVNLDLAFTDGGVVRIDELDVNVFDSSGRVLSNDSIRLRKSRTTRGAVISMIPYEFGYHKVSIFCQRTELPSSPIFLHVLSPEDSRANSRTLSSPVNTKFDKKSAQSSSSSIHLRRIERSDSGSEVDISHKSFEQRRLHIIKQLEAQTSTSIKESNLSSPSPSQAKEWLNRTEEQESLQQAVILEASAHREMLLSRPADVGLVSFSGLTEPCSVGSIVEVVINAHGECSVGSVHVDAVSPSGRTQKCPVSKRANCYMATFTPQEVGRWKIGILYEGKHIRSSPFSCQVFDASLVNVYGLDVGLVGQELKFTVNASQAGQGDLKVSVLRHGREIKTAVDEQGNSQVYRINFVPDGAGQYKIHVLFNRMEVKGSPFILDIADASTVSVYGENLRMGSVGKLATFMVHAVGAESKDIVVSITAPSGRVKTAQVLAIDEASFKAEWTPQEAGEHSIDVRLYNQSVYESPFACNVGVPELVSVRSMPRRIYAKSLYKDHSFEIDASAAGSGNLEIMINGGRVPCRVRELGSRQYMAIFTPTQAVTHTIEMRFNGEEVSGSPWKISVDDRTDIRQNMDRTMSYYSELSGPGLVRAPVNKLATFDIAGDGLELADIQARIYGPDGREYPIRIIPKDSGKFAAEYRIEQVGEHLLNVLIAGRKVDGSPLSVSGYSAERVRLEPLGGGAIGQPVQFVVDAVDAGKGQLEISVNQGRVPNNVQMQGAGRCLVTFIPQHPGTYVIDVTFNGEQVHGCPIKVEILPKQVGQTVQTNLTPTAVSTAISAGGSGIAGAFRHSPRSPTSPTSPSLLKHVRQRSTEINPRSPTLLRDARGRAEKPWLQSYAPTNSRLSSSLSPNREWSAANAYDRIYGGTDRTLSHGDPSRSRLFTETTTTSTVRHTPSPTGTTRHVIESTTSLKTRTPSPTSIRSRHIAERQIQTPSPTRYERRYESPSGHRNYSETSYRSPSPTIRSELRVGESPFRSTPSPGPGERIRKIEQIDPVAAEEERERRRAQEEREKSKSVGYTVAQYGQPGTVTLERRHSQDRSTVPRYFDENVAKKNHDQKVITSTSDRIKRDESPEYSFVYEKFERKKDQPPSPTHAYLEKIPSPSITSRKDEQRIRSASPPPDYNTEPIFRESGISTIIKPGGEPYIETITTRTTTFTPSSRKAHEYENIDRKPEVPHRTAIPEGYEVIESHRAQTVKTSVDKDLGFLRTQSEVMDRDVSPSPLHRTTEKESIFAPPPDTLSRSTGISPIPLSEKQFRTAEYLRIKEEDDKILEKHGYVKRASQEPSIEIQEPASDIRDDVIEVAGSKDNLLAEKGVDVSARIQALEPVAELPHSPVPSTTTTPHTTPKTSMKFRKDGKEGKPFDFGRSKFTSKHEVVKRGKDIEVKLENLKLSKDDTLRFVVMPPIRNQIGNHSSTPQLAQHEIETKVKKSGSKYEILFRPTEVGTHKVFAYVNDIQHPLSPFNIRVYDASEIIVGEIPSQSNLNDTVEFTVDAGRAGFGNLEMAIKDADGVIIPSHVAQLESGTAKFLVTFTPATKGQHTVNITFNKEVLKNSPFEVNIVDAPVTESIDTTISPSLSKKDLKKEKEDKKREEKERAKREKEEKAATLKKDKKSKHKFISKTSVTKIPSLSRVGQPSSLIVDVAGHDRLEICVTDNKKNQIGTDILEVESGVMQINFTPVHVGDHEIEVKYGGVPVTGSPFTCRAYDPANIKVGTIPKGLLDKPVYFTVDASEAGVGNLEVAVNEGRVPSMAHALGQHKYDISFVPKENCDHTITVRFNNEPVPGSPFICHLVSAAQASASGPGLERVPVDELTEIKIQTDGTSEDMPEIRIHDPQSNDLPVNITRSKNDDTLCIATYTPKCVGNHQIDITLSNEPIAGSPFTAKAYDARMTRLTPCEKAVIGKPCTFTIDAARAGAGNMEIIVSVDNRNVPNFVQAEGQAKFKVSFTPQEAKEHIISVRFNGVSVPGSPMRCAVEPGQNLVSSNLLTAVAPDMKERTELVKELQSAQVGQKRGFTVENPGGRAADCNVVIIDPRGGPLPVRCYKQQDDSFWVEFTPEHIGMHTIEVTFGDIPVAGSPFHCEVVDPKKVLVKGLNEPLLLRHATTISVDRRNAGAGDLQADITDPSGNPLKMEMIKSPGGEDRFTFLPNKIGPHKVNIRIAGFQVPGYPQTILVAEQEQPGVYGSAIDQSIKINEPASLIFDPKKANGGLKISVLGPKDNKVRYNVMKRPNGTSEVVFYPDEVGTYVVSIEFNNKLVSGSPFTVRVIDPSKVIINDLDMDRDGSLLLRLAQQNVFDVDATAAGPGKLRAEVRDADSALIGDGPAVDDLGYGKYRVSFTPKQPGRYSIYLYWNELPVESAFPVRARSSEDQPTTSKEVLTPISHSRDKSSSSYEDDVYRVMVRGDGLHVAQLKKQNEFIVDGSDLTREGRITSTLYGTKADVPVRVQQLGHNVFKATYTPLTCGAYELHILWNGKHVKGSPFKVSADSFSSPADLIVVDNSSLKIGIINEDIKTVIDTRRAGPGQLSAQCMGPVKLAYCELYDHRDGTYTLSVRPSEVGKHTLVIKYNEQHVHGSPFLIHVSLPPDPSKVRVYGPGIEHGILSLFKSNFIVETRGAGAGQLTVRVRGPKGAFNVEMQREKKNERTIHCKYEPKEPGDYQVEVKWHGEHVPGSPFLVMIVDTEQELSRFLRGEAPSPTPATPFVPPGWVGPPPMFPPMAGPRQRLMGPPVGHPMGPPPPGALLPYAAPASLPPRHKTKYH